MSDSGDQDPTDQDPTGLSEEQLDDVAGGISMFELGGPPCRKCGKRHVPMDGSACSQ